MVLFAIGLALLSIAVASGWLTLRASAWRRVPRATEPFEVAPALVVALDYIAQARTARGRKLGELCLFARLALDDARAAASTGTEQAAIAVVTQLLGELPAASR